MKLTKTQLREMISGEVNKLLSEGMAVDENEYFRMKAKLVRDFTKIYELVEQLEDAMYDEDTMLPEDLVDQIRNIAGRHVR